MKGPSDSSLGRAMYAQIVPDVRKHVEGVRLTEAWVWCASRRRGHWEFHFRDFYWHGKADGAYDARYRGWAAYLESLGVEGYVR